MSEINCTAPLLSRSERADVRVSQILAKARELESVFLAEMLEHQGLGVGGGASHGEEEQTFASYLRDGYARLMVEVGGVGLALPLNEAMSARFDNCTAQDARLKKNAYVSS